MWDVFVLQAANNKVPKDTIKNGFFCICSHNTGSSLGFLCLKCLGDS